MKKFFLSLLFSIPIVVSYGQESYNNSAFVDTITCFNDSSGIAGEFSNLSRTCLYSLKQGFNQLYEISGLLFAEGVAIRKGKNNIRIGSWTYYKEGVINEIITYDNKGNSISSLSFYLNGQIKYKSYKYGKGKFFSEYYNLDGTKLK